MIQRSPILFNHVFQIKLMVWYCTLDLVSTLCTETRVHLSLLYRIHVSAPSLIPTSLLTKGSPFFSSWYIVERSFIEIFLFNLGVYTAFTIQDDVAFVWTCDGATVASHWSCCTHSLQLFYTNLQGYWWIQLVCSKLISLYVASRWNSGMSFCQFCTSFSLMCSNCYRTY